ncbi:MAG TPA: 5-formyltetrahydrofolate cyclo-ligase [Verrucomicrobiae bacterium]|nr:5-formyltetrahydrofolate cyclo-ligase [Verrucomicrobiae bacterium]
MSAGRDAKRTLRRAMVDRLASVTADERAAWSRVATENLLAIPELAACGEWMAFASMPGEIDTTPLIGALLKVGRRVALPRIAAASKTLGAYWIRELGDLSVNRWGIPEPEPNPEAWVEPTRLAAIVVPGLAFDARGARLGRAGGYYDRFLRAAGRGPLRVGFFYAIQEVPVVPQEEWDEALDFVATDSGVIRCGRGIADLTG